MIRKTAQKRIFKEFQTKNYLILNNLKSSVSNQCYLYVNKNYKPQKLST